MKKNVLFLLGVLAMVINMYAQNVDIGVAKNIARNFFYESVNQFDERAFSDIKIKESFIKQDKNNKTVYYVFNIVGGGFIAVSAYDAAIPVIFYAFKGEYGVNKKNPAFDFWTEQYVNEISDAIANNERQNAEISKKWTHLKSKDPSKLKICREKAIPPLLVSEWNQGVYYDEQCPVDSAGPGNHAVTGCVATCMGQILYYYKFPPTGTGSYSYYHSVYGTISADFANTTYDWNAMQNKLTDYNYPVAILLHHLGVAVDMDYGPNGSAMWNHSAAYAYRTYFKMCPGTQYIFRDSATLNWDSVIIANLDAKKPLYYGGWVDDSTFTEGHAFVCDGYQMSTYYHFNWGWGGVYDGFFYTDNLTPGGSNFNHAQEIIANIYPDTLNYIYPIGCAATDTFSSASGTLNDGSGPINYENNLNCNYQISPVCGNKLSMNFDRFELADGDTVIVLSDVMPLDTFTIMSPPVLSSETNPTTLTSETGNLYINFRTDNSNTANGWDVSYFSKYCEATSLLEDSSGVVADGSEDCFYKNNENCRWTISPPGADSIYIDFSKFDLAPNLYDYILIHKTAVSVQNLIGKYDYTNVPDQIAIPSGTAIITFKTNSQETADGWEFSYLATFNPLNINNTISEKLNAMVYPNPFNENTKVSFYLNTDSQTSIAIKNVYGVLLASYKTKSSRGYNEIPLNKIIRDLKPGIYFMTLSTKEGTVTKKIICTK